MARSRLGILFKRYLLAGVLVLAPLAVTVYILTSGFTILDRFLGSVVARLLGHHVTGAGAVLTVLLTVLAGMIATNVVGRRLIHFTETLLARIPVVRSVYVGVKQVLDAFSVNSRAGFSRAVLVEYPRKDAWSIGFVTSKGDGVKRDSLPPNVASVFVPTSPNPTSGFLIIVSEEDLVPLDMSVEAAFKVILSGGMVWGSQENHPS